MKIFHRIFPFLLLGYHLVFAWRGYQYILVNGGDARRYWFVGADLSQSSWSDYFNPGTDVVKFFTFPLVKYLQLPFWSGFLIFSLVSFAGVLLLYRMLMHRAGDHPRLQLLVIIMLLLPNLHFWTSLIGKEAVIIIPFVVMGSEIFRKRYFSFLLFLSVAFIALIRPHVAFVVLVSYVISLLLTVKMKKKTIALMTGGLITSTAIFAYVLSTLQDFTGGFHRVLRKYEAHILHFQKTDGYVPLDGYPLSYKIFTFYFRPLPFEKEGLFYHIISTENAVLLLLSSGSVYWSVRHFHVLRKRMLFVFPSVLLLLFSVMYVYAYANYGIIMRTRIMAVPFLYLLILEMAGVGNENRGSTWNFRGGTQQKM